VGRTLLKRSPKHVAITKDVADPPIEIIPDDGVQNHAPQFGEAVEGTVGCMLEKRKQFLNDFCTLWTPINF
jgi:hypothetical protein